MSTYEKFLIEKYTLIQKKKVRGGGKIIYSNQFGPEMYRCMFFNFRLRFWRWNPDSSWWKESRLHQDKNLNDRISFQVILLKRALRTEICSSYFVTYY